MLLEYCHLVNEFKNKYKQKSVYFGCSLCKIFDLKIEWKYRLHYYKKKKKNGKNRKEIKTIQFG